MPRTPTCTRCPLHQGAQTVCVWGAGDASAKIMLVGEGPGSEEDKAGRPFVGPAGRVLDRALASAGLSRGAVWISNLVKCRPPRNRSPEPQEVKACFAYLAEEIATVQPTVIVALGGSAAKAVTGSTSPIGRLRGRVLTPASGVRVGGARVIATFHPAAYLHRRDETTLTAMVADLQLARRLSEGEERTTDAAALLLPAWGADDLKRTLTPFLTAGAGPVAVDCEWTAVADRRIAWPWTVGAELYSVSLSQRVGDQVQSVGFAWPPASVRSVALLSKFLTSRDCLFHNAMADMLWLDSVGLRYRLAGDTMLLAYLLDEEQPTGLEVLATTKAGLAPWKQPLWHTRPTDANTWHDLLRYNATDTVATLAVARALYHELHTRSKEERERLLRVYRHLLLPALPAYVEMAREGVPLHEGRLWGAAVRERERERELSREFAMAVGVGVHPEQAQKLATSTSQTQTFLKHRYQLDLPGSAKDDLTPYASQYPVVGMIQGIRNTQKNLGTYLLPWIRLLAEQQDGRLHSVYRLGRVRTGRTSAETEIGGSLQVAPRERWVRKLIALDSEQHPEYADWGFAIADYAQLEIRVVAWLAPEPHMIEIYNRPGGGDLHVVTAAIIANVPEERVTKDQRQLAKPANFGLLYGLQAPGYRDYALQKYGVRLSMAEAIRQREQFFATYPGLIPWHKRCETVDFPRGYVVTPFGRYRRHLLDPRKAINTPIQSTGNDLTILALTALHQQFHRYHLRARIVGMIHDSILTLRPESEAGAVRELLITTMERPPTERLGVLFEAIPVPFPVELKEGPSWGTALQTH